MNGKQVKLFLVDGTPGGLTTAEITNWTGHVLSARRSDPVDLTVIVETNIVDALPVLDIRSA